jgi:hypothetical protein
MRFISPTIALSMRASISLRKSTTLGPIMITSSVSPVLEGSNMADCLIDGECKVSIPLMRGSPSHLNLTERGLTSKKVWLFWCQKRRPSSRTGSGQALMKYRENPAGAGSVSRPPTKNCPKPRPPR